MDYRVSDAKGFTQTIKDNIAMEREAKTSQWSLACQIDMYLAEPLIYDAKFECVGNDVFVKVQEQLGALPQENTE